MKYHIIYLFTLINYTCLGQIITKQIETEINNLVDPRINNETPGVIIGIIKDDKLIFNKSYGLANLSYKIPNNPKMVYNIGSASKQFIGYAFAILHTSGKLNLDDPVEKYIPNWPKFEHKVTIKHLLTHTSGYRDAYTISNLAGRKIGVDFLSKKECLNVVKRQKKLEFEPGTRHIYNSSAWVILTEILENATRNLADDWVRSNIFKPLQMNDTQIECYAGDIIYDAAESYLYDEKEKGYVNINNNKALFGVADIYTNIYDLMKWFKNYDSAYLGGQEVKNMFLNPYILKNGFNTQYGLGINLKPFYGIKRYSHISLHEAFHSDLSYFPEYKLGIITISNFGAYGEVSSGDIAKILLKDKLKSPKKESIPTFSTYKKNLYTEFEGIYICNSFNKVISLNIKNDTLLLNNKAKLCPISKTCFKIKGIKNLKLHLIKTDKNKVIAEKNNAKMTFTQAKQWKPKTDELTEYLGNYWSEEIGTIYKIKLKRNHLIIKHRWLENVNLYPITKDFFSSSNNFFIKVTRNEKGEIKGFDLNTRGTLNIIFEKK